MQPKPPTGKSTIKNDPFAAVIPFAVEPEVVETPAPTPEPPKRTVEAKPTKPASVKADDHGRPAAGGAKTGRQKLTVHLPAELAERVKNAAYWNPRLTIAGIAEQGIKSVIERVEREHGGRYPPRDGELIGGRPIK